MFARFPALFQFNVDTKAGTFSNFCPKITRANWRIVQFLFSLAVVEQIDKTVNSRKVDFIKKRDRANGQIINNRLIDVSRF